jgi:hypothetical protein
MAVRPFSSSETQLKLVEVLDRPLSAIWCAVGWIASTTIFVGLTILAGGVTEGDSNVSVFAAWAIAHGDVACAYLPSGVLGYAPTAPVYPLFSGGVVALLRIGHGVMFPTQAQLGLRCVTATAAMNHWALTSGAWSPTLRIGYVSWFVLMGGAIALLRASGRGRCRWEPLALVVLACVPPVSMCLYEYFHPQDVFAMGLALAGLASALRARWVWTGVLLGLSVATQQFALLVLVPILVVAPRPQLPKIVVSALAVVAVVAAPVVLLSSGRALTSVLVGTGESSASSSLLTQTGIHGSLLFAISRFLPIALSLALAWWVVQRLGTAARQPIALVSLIATSLSFRLIFEVSLWGYYFMAVAATLVLLDFIRGRLRFWLVAWLVLVTVVADRYLVNHAAYQPLPIWLWQIILVSIAVALAVSPLVAEVRAQRAVEAARVG